MTGYLMRAETARTLKAVILSLPPHAHMSGDAGRVSDTAIAPRPGVAAAAAVVDRAEIGNDRLA